SKIGTRNAMVIAVASFCLCLDSHNGGVGTGIGSAAPTPRRAPQAERVLAGALAEGGLWASPAALPAGPAGALGGRGSGAAAPIDDVRGTAASRRRALAVMARRTLGWAWSEYQGRVGGGGR